MDAIRQILEGGNEDKSFLFWIKIIEKHGLENHLDDFLNWQSEELEQSNQDPTKWFLKHIGSKHDFSADELFNLFYSMQQLSHIHPYSSRIAKTFYIRLSWDDLCEDLIESMNVSINHATSDIYISLLLSQSKTTKHMIKNALNNVAEVYYVLHPHAEDVFHTFQQVNDIIEQIDMDIIEAVDVNSMGVNFELSVNDITSSHFTIIDDNPISKSISQSAIGKTVSNQAPPLPSSLRPPPPVDDIPSSHSTIIDDNPISKSISQSAIGKTVRNQAPPLPPSSRPTSLPTSNRTNLLQDIGKEGDLNKVSSALPLGNTVDGEVPSAGKKVVYASIMQEMAAKKNSGLNKVEAPPERKVFDTTSNNTNAFRGAKLNHHMAPIHNIANDLAEEVGKIPKFKIPEEQPGMSEGNDGFKNAFFKNSADYISLKKTLENFSGRSDESKKLLEDEELTYSVRTNYESNILKLKDISDKYITNWALSMIPPIQKHIELSLEGYDEQIQNSLLQYD